ncbi:camphor resistance protein CrcB [Pseudooceanicola batsensis HTCC2597]|uniref:Camphor resistance protein CrcB n=1 Tax=Pseudooceanicola batsensis (strain ATCC BAA-863 / DSM 15984 / KCTC 12145 / HTCC2597) TaxID=252305 RepID=A3TX39_PSEBH|nr:DUF302 domain-containing protein [Pseudooceanicola batsensis]EAQ03399.1 camphor resistance protein CrcB [Pseudooceanicola batsensis HTCC2597]
MFRPVLAACLLAAVPAHADYERREAQGSVSDAMDRLTAAAEEAGATIFARIDHAGGATGAGMELRPSELLIFGNPMLGTMAMQEDPLAGLVLPMKMLAYEDAEGKVWIAYEEVEEMFDDLDVDDDLDVLDKMEDALENLSRAAAG